MGPPQTEWWRRMPLEVVVAVSKTPSTPQRPVRGLGIGVGGSRGLRFLRAAKTFSVRTTPAQRLAACARMPPQPPHLDMVPISALREANVTNLSGSSRSTQRTQSPRHRHGKLRAFPPRPCDVPEESRLDLAHCEAGEELLLEDSLGVHNLLLGITHLPDEINHTLIPLSPPGRPWRGPPVPSPTIGCSCTMRPGCFLLVLLPVVVVVRMERQSAELAAELLDALKVLIPG